MNIAAQSSVSLAFLLAIVPAVAYSQPTTLGDGAFAGTANYGFRDGRAALRVLSGSRARPAESCDASLIVEKTSSCAATERVNASIYGAIHKTERGNLVRATAIYGEAQDEAGGEGSFVEGGRFQGTVVADRQGSGYGVIGVAGTAPGVGFQYLIGMESDVENNSGKPAPAPAAFDRNHYSASYVATSGMTRDARVADVAFVVNPYSTAGFQAGFMVARNSVVESGSAFVSQADTTVGLDLGRGRQSWAAVLMPNSSPVRARSADGRRDLNVLYVDPENALVLGAEAARVAFAGDVVVNGVIHQRSDSAAKSAIAPLDASLEKISSLHGVSFEWRESRPAAGRQIGLLAEDVERVFPEAVRTDASGSKSVAYAQLVAPVVEAVKSLRRENDVLRARIEDQQSALAALASRLRALEGGVAPLVPPSTRPE